MAAGLGCLGRMKLKALLKGGPSVIALAGMPWPHPSIGNPVALRQVTGTCCQPWGNKGQARCQPGPRCCAGSWDELRVGAGAGEQPC